MPFQKTALAAEEMPTQMSNTNVWAVHNFAMREQIRPRASKSSTPNLPRVLEITEKKGLKFWGLETTETTDLCE